MPMRRAADSGSAPGTLRNFTVRLLAATVYRRLVLFEMDLTTDSAVTPPVAGVQVALLEAGEIEEYRVLRPDTPAVEVRARLTSGDRCFVVRRDGRLVRALWISRGSARSPYLGCDVPLTADEAYVYDLFAAAGARGGDIGRTVQATMSRSMSAEGCRMLLALVLPENQPAIRMMGSHDYRPAAIVATLGIGSRVRVFRRRLRPRSRLGRSIGAARWLDRESRYEVTGEIPHRRRCERLKP